MKNPVKNKDLEKRIFAASGNDFTGTALLLFRFQYDHNPVYRSYCDALKINLHTVKEINDIPFLPISFFKTHRIITGEVNTDFYFESSGTTQTVNSRHYINDLTLYRQSFESAFRLFYGSPEGYCIIGLLPSYLERKASSLVMMVDELIKISSNPNSGFYLYDHEKLYDVLLTNEKAGIKTLLIGVTYALLDFAERFPMKLEHTIVMETGGMKGRREEMTREQVHGILKQQLNVSDIHSEYGMTELLSQAYSAGSGIFNCPPWMRILLREADDPLQIIDAPANGTHARRGIINVIDLANINSCAFIATDDLGKLYPDNSFEVLGRTDASDTRGCSLMMI